MSKKASLEKERLFVLNFKFYKIQDYKNIISNTKNLSKSLVIIIQ